MERTHIVKTRVDSLSENLKLAESRKKYFLDYSQKLYTKYVIGDISREFYLNALYEKHDGRNIQEWINFYDARIQEYKKQLQQQTNSQVKSLIVLVSIAFFIVLGLIFFISRSGFNFTGFSIQEEKQTFTENLNLDFSEAVTYNWQIQNLGQLLSAKISGTIRGQGRQNVKVYFDDILILDSSKLQDSSTQSNSSSYSDSSNSSSETNPEEAQNQTSPFQESPLDSEKLIEFSGICEDACNLEQLNLNKSSYELRIEIENAQLKIEKIEYETLNLIEVPEQTTPETNETVSNETTPIVPEENTTSPEIPEQNITQPELPTNQTEINQTNITEPINITNQTEINQTNVTETLTNATVFTTQLPAKIGEPVKWIKKVNPESLGNLTINLPENAENISVKKSKEDKKQTSGFSITGAVISSEGETSGGFLTRFFAFLSRIFSGKGLTGFAVENEPKESKKEKTKEKKIHLEIDEVTEYVVEYETLAPTATEQQTARGKQVIVSGPDTIHYENVLAFTTLDESLRITNPEKIRIHWVENNTFISPSSVNDTNQDGIYDYIEWIVPHLSTQTFEIIVITKAEHLDENRNFVEDIYEQVKEQDNVWSSEISNNEYVRITFEQNLTSNKDITIFPRIVSGTPRVEVYEKDETNKITEFSTINSNQFNQVLLTNLEGIQDTFDLRVVGGSVEFDYIVDPTLESVSGSYFDDFESGLNTTWWTGVTGWTRSTSYAQYGSYQINNAGSATGEQANLSVDTTGYTQVNLSFYVYLNRKTSANVGFLIHNGTHSIILGNQTATTTSTLKTFTLPASANNNPNLKIMFYYTGSHTKDRGGIDNVNVTGLSDSFSPIFTNYGGTANNTPYTSSGSYVFNVTITNTNGTAWLQFNGVNYSATNTSSTFTKTLSSLSAGTYTYRWWAYGNGTSNKINNSGARDYTIAKATTPCNVSFNVSSPVSWGTTFLVWHNCDTTATLYRNGTSITNNTPQNLASSAYNFTVIRTDQTNYSSVYNETVFVVNKQTLTASLTNDKAWTRNYDGTANAIGYSESNTGDSDVVYKIYRNGADKGSSDSVSSAGTYNYVLNSTGGQNFSSSSSLDAQTLTINKIAPTLTLDITNATYPAQGTINASESNSADSDVVYNLYINGVLETSGSDIDLLKTLAAGEHTIVYNTTGGTNYSSASVTKYLTVFKGTPTGTVQVSPSTTVTYPTETTVQGIETNAGDSDVTYSLFRENVLTTNSEVLTLGVGVYNYKFNSTEGQNWTAVASLDTETLTINQNTGSCDVLFNESSPISYPASFKVWTNCNSAFTLYKNGTSITNNSDQTLGAGVWNFTAIRTDQTNYSNIYDSEMFTINKATPTASLTNDRLWTFTYDSTPANIGISESNVGDSDVTYVLWKNDVNVGSSNSQASAGTFNYKINTTGGENYTSVASLDAQTLTINKATSSVYTYVNNTRQDIQIHQGDSIYLNATTQTGDSNAILKLYKNATLLNQGTSPLSNLTLFDEINYYNITGFYEASENYTSSYETWYVDVISANTAPTYSLISHNSTGIGETALFSIYIEDEQLNPNGQYIFSTNNSGEWQNDSEIAFTSTPSWANATKVLSSTEGTVVGYMWYFKDNDDVWNSTEIQTLTTQKVFISVWNTSKISTGSTNSNQVGLPLESSGIYNFVVNWGDGNQNTITSYNQPEVNHTYSSEGEYTIRITGTIQGFRFNNVGDKLKLVDIKSWGPLNLGNSGSYFYGCSTMRITATDILNLTGTTTMYQAFRSASNLTTVPSMNDWDMSEINFLRWMFYYAENFNQNISNWDTSKVNNTVAMFFGAKNFNQSLANWNTSKVIEMASMFSGATNFNQNISNWDTSNVTNMASMFNSAANFNQNISNWNTSKVTSMSNMFNSATNFNQPIENWDTSDVTDFYGMFQSTANFNQPIENWDTSNVTRMSNMFYSSKFNQSLANWNTSKVTNMDYMFYQATSFNQNLSAWNVSILSSAISMFEGVTLSTENYDGLLTGWAAQSPNIKNSVNFSGGNSQYCSGVSARNDTLIGTHSWVITDGGEDPSCQQAPTIPFVESLSSQDLIESDKKPITFYFTAQDENGASNLNDSTAKAYFQKAGETTRYNESCVAGTPQGNQKNYSCTIDMWYFDKAGLWTINVSVQDNDELYAENSSTTFSINTLTAMKISPTAMNWPANILPTQTDVPSSTNPLVVNNTGNAESMNIQITALDLRGLTDTSKFIFANNFSAQATSDGCSGDSLVNNSGVTITSAILEKGNNSLNYENSTSGQQRVYFCLKALPQGVISQEYSSSGLGSWTIKILLVAFAPALKKKKKKFNKNNKILNLAIKLTDELKENYSKEKELLISQLVDSIRQEYGLNKKEILRLLRHEQEIPVTIFSKELGALESIIKYMKENLNLSYHEIALIIGRDERTVWTAYHKSLEKQKNPIVPKATEITIPISLFGNKELTVLEFVITHLKEKGLTLKEISMLLQRDQRNIWLINSRASKKLN